MGNIFDGMTPVMKVNIPFSNDSEIDISEIHSSEDRTVVETAYITLQRLRKTLIDVDKYHGCGEVIRLALSNPSNEEHQKNAFLQICPNVSTIQNFYNLALEAAQAIADLSRRIPDAEAFEAHQAIIHVLGELVVSCFQFDQRKMLKPDIQNDFSYYRRSLGSPIVYKLNLATPVSSDEANGISMWVAQSLPMLNTIKNINLDAIANLANLCCGMVLREACPNAVNHVLSVMVACIILYDKLQPGGAFHSSSPIKIAKALKALSLCQSPVDKTVLSNSLKYSTVHLNDGTTPASVKKSLETM